MSETRLDAMGLALGHRFTDADLLAKACTHASACDPHASAPDRLRGANERMEFVGDALLGAALCVLLYRRHPDASEGQLSRLKSKLASRAMLAKLIEQAQLLPHCKVGPQMREPWPDSVKANLMESILAAIFLEAGWDPLLAAVEKLYADALSASGDEEDAKTRLQEWCLEHHGKLPAYVSERSGGSDHQPEFTARVSIGDDAATASGSSRRRAEAAAAEDLYRLLVARQQPSA